MATRAQARSGDQANLAMVVTRAFTVGRMANIFVILALGIGLRLALGQFMKPYFLWLLVFYFVLLISEMWWLARKLKRLPINGRQ